MWRQRAIIKRVGGRGSRAKMLNNSPNINRVPGSDTVKELLRDNSKLDIGHGDIGKPTNLRDNSKTLGQRIHQKGAEHIYQL